MLELVLTGLVIALEPLPVLGFILVLATDRGLRNGAAFIAGWVTCLVVIIVGTITLTGGEPPSRGSAPGTIASLASIVIGAGLVVLAVVRAKAPRYGARPQPGWVRRLENLRPAGAATVGVLLQPWPLVAAGAALVVRADVSSVASVASLVAFVVLGTSSYAAMEIAYVARPERAAARLDALRLWLEGHRDRGIVVVIAVLGVWLVVNGIADLVASS